MMRTETVTPKSLKRTAAVPVESSARAVGAVDKTLADRALRLVRDDILNGKLAPGSRLRINVLQQQYELGLSPLREALLRPSSEGLVVGEGQRGFAVVPVSLAELQDLTKARTCLDSAALTQAIALGDAQWEARVIAANHLLTRTPLPVDAKDVAAAKLWEQRHRAFHHTLIAGCGSDWLLRLHTQLADQSERYRTIRILHHQEKGAQVRDTVDEHTAITNAVLRRDAQLATQLMGRHIAATASAMTYFFEPKTRARKPV